MKNSVILLISCLLFITINNGCHKDPDIIDVNISISVKPEVVAYNGSAVISWTVSDGSYTRVETFGPYELTDKMTIDNIRENKTYTLYVYDKNDKVVKYQNFEVKSGDWTSSVFGLLTHESWVYKKAAIKYKLTNYEWTEPKEDVNSSWYNAVYDFKDDNICYIHLVTGDDWKYNFHLDADCDTLFLKGYDPQKIVKLDQDSLVLELESDFWEDTNGDGQIDTITPAFFRYYFVRKNQ